MVFARRPFFLAMAAAQVAAPLSAQSVVTSTGPDLVAVTIYREPGRSNGGDLDLTSLGGFAFITETRTVTVPEGQANIRFEGVASGIIPASAIVSGLPGGVIQKNRDARLLSPAALIDGSFGKTIHLRRTSRITGRVNEEDAEIIAGPTGGVILKTKNGIEALGCAGLPESTTYDGLPDGLTAKPTLSVTTRSLRTVTATVQLSYLATGFDWTASYIARVNPDGKTLSLYAWLTLANSNGESFARADTQVVAGSLSRGDDARADEDQPSEPKLSLKCWPLDITSTYPKWGLVPQYAFRGRRAYDEDKDGEIIVTAQRQPEALQSVPVAVSALSAEQLELGDLKLYHIPERVTVAANAQKQITLFEKPKVAYDQIYVSSIYVDGRADGPHPATIVLRTKNTKDKGLGVPLPSGGLTLYRQSSNGLLLVGSNTVADTSVNQDVEFEVGQSAQVQVAESVVRNGVLMNATDRRLVEVTNANPFPVSVEIGLIDGWEGALFDPNVKIGRKNGQNIWIAKLPANGKRSMTYRLKPAR